MFHSGQNGFLTTSDQGYLENCYFDVPPGVLFSNPPQPSSSRKGHIGMEDIYPTTLPPQTSGGYIGVPVNGISTTLSPWENHLGTLVGKEGETGI